MISWGLHAALAADVGALPAADRPVGPMLDAVVVVQQGSTMCAGVHVGAGRIATAYHCVASGGRPRLTTRDGARVEARIRSVSPRLDLAILDADLAGRASLPIALTPPAAGERVLAMGHPFGDQVPFGLLSGTLRWSVADGIVSAVGPSALQISAPLNPGNSGGPVVNSAGEVVGIASRRLSADNVAFASRADQLPAIDSRPVPLSPFGGTLSLHGVLLTQTGGDGLLALGPRLEVALRDHVLLDVAAYVPWSPRLTAARFGRAVSSVGEGRAGLRLRAGRGPWAVRFDAAIGATALQVFAAEPGDPLDVRSTFQPGALVAFALHLRSAGFEAAYVPEVGISRASLIVRWPSVLRVF